MESIIRTNEEHQGVDFKIHAIDIRLIENETNQRHLSLKPEYIDDKGNLIQQSSISAQVQKEYNLLIPLSESIKEKKLQNPISVFKKGNKIILKSGQRRLLASLMAGQRTILARVWDSMPDHYDLEIDQWVENFNREGLATKDAIQAVRKIALLWEQQNNKKIGVTELANIIYCSKSQAVKYHALLSLPGDLDNAIENGSLTSLKKIYDLSKIKDENQRINLISEVIKGDVTQEMMTKISTLSNIKRQNYKKEIKNGRNPQKINLGNTKSISLVCEIIDVILKQNKYCTLKDILDINFIDYDYKNASKQFKKLLNLMEKIVGEETKENISNFQNSSRTITTNA